MLCRNGHLFAGYADALFTGSENIRLPVFCKRLQTIQVFMFETVFRNSFYTSSFHFFHLYYFRFTVGAKSTIQQLYLSTFTHSPSE